ELDDVLEGTTTEPERLARLEQVADDVTEPLLSLMLAAYFWDAAIIILEESGGVYGPAEMPVGDRRALAERLQARARALVEAADRADPQLTQATGMVAAMGVAPPAWAGASPSRPYRAPAAHRERKRSGLAFFQLGGGLGPVALSVGDASDGVAFTGHVFGRLVLATSAKAPVRAGMTLGAHFTGGG